MCYTPLRQWGWMCYTPLRQWGSMCYTSLREWGWVCYTPLRQWGWMCYTPLRQTVGLNVLHPSQTVRLNVLHPSQTVRLIVLHPSQTVGLNVLHPSQTVHLFFQTGCDCPDWLRMSLLFYSPGSLRWSWGCDLISPQSQTNTGGMSSVHSVMRWPLVSDHWSSKPYTVSKTRQKKQKIASTRQWTTVVLSLRLARWKQT